MGGTAQNIISTIKAPDEVLDQYRNVFDAANTAAAKPFQIYSENPADFVAQINAQQQMGISGINAAAGSYQPFYNSAMQAAQAGTGYATPGELNIDQFMNPYQQDVINSTMALMGQANEQAQSGALGTATSSGAFGGDRAGIAAANLSQQQNLAMGSTLAEMNAANYNQALAAAQQQQGVQLAADQANLDRQLQAATTMGNLGTGYQSAGLAGAEAQINAGTLQQQTEQAGLTALYNQFLQQQAYPFQTAQFLADITGAIGPNYGSTTEQREVTGSARGGRIGKADGGITSGMPYSSMFPPAQNAGAYVPPTGYVPVGGLAPAQMMVPDIVASEGPSTASDISSMVSAFGTLQGMGTTGAAHGGRIYRADGGAAYLNAPKPTGVVPPAGYMGPVAAEADKPKDTATMKVAPIQQGNSGGLGDILSLITTAAAFMNRGGRVGYADGGVPMWEMNGRSGSPTLTDQATAPGLAAAEEERRRQAAEWEKTVGQMRANAVPPDQLNIPSGLGMPAVGSEPRDVKAGVVPAGTAVAQEPEPSRFALGLFPVRPEPGAEIRATGLSSPSVSPGASGVTGIIPVDRPIESAPTLGSAVPAPSAGGVSPPSLGSDQSRAARNNNPGNLEYGDFAKAHGAIGTDGRFAIFPDRATGDAAMRALLETGTYQDLTVAGAINRYSPPSENDTGAYVNAVASAVGVDPNTPMSQLTPDQKNAMVSAMQRIEGGAASPAAAPPALAAANMATMEPKAYEDRNFLGRLAYTEDGKLNPNFLMSILAGLGTAAVSPAKSKLGAFAQGLGSFANAYTGLQKQAADIDLTRAEAARERVATDVNRFFTVGEGGIPMVALNGRTITLDQYLQNPQSFSTGDRAVDAQILSEAQKRASSAPASTGVFSTPVIQDYIGGEAKSASMDFRGARDRSAAIESSAEAMAEAARSSRASTLLQTGAVANLVSPDAAVRSGALGDLKAQAIRYVNDILGTASQMTGRYYEPISGADDAQILNKAAIAASLDRSAGSGQQSYEALSAILAANPNVSNEPEANAALMATLMLSQQRAIDAASFMRDYKLDPNNTYRLVTDAPKAFDEAYRRKYLAEEGALKELVLHGNEIPTGWERSPMSYLMDQSLSPQDRNEVIRKALLSNIIGYDEAQVGALAFTNGQIDMARYFGG
jgi:hypothetical protein